MPIEAADFKRALGQFATGITVVTTRDAQGRPLGLTVNAFCSVSLDPPLVLVCIENDSEAAAGLASSLAYGVSVLDESQERWSRRFAVPGSAKFGEEPLTPGAGGLLFVPDALAHIVCRVAGAHPAGDHTVYVGEVRSLESRRGRPLVYHGSAYRRLDDAPRQTE